jgi:hypothetical protein
MAALDGRGKLDRTVRERTTVDDNGTTVDHIDHESLERIKGTDELKSSRAV